MHKTREIVNTQKKLVSSLETIKTVEILNKNEFLGIDGDFCRTLKIKVNGNDFTVNWFHNQSTIQSDWCEIPFDSIVLDSPTWPRDNKNLNLQLISDGKTVAVI